MDTRTMIVHSTVHQNNMNIREDINMVVVSCLNCGTCMQIPPHARRVRCGVCQGINEFTDLGLNAQPVHGAMGAFNALPCPPPSPHCPKKEVICGISYLGSHHELNGGIQDAKEMRSFLIDCGFPEFSIMMLTEKETDPFKIPTKDDLRRAIRWLVQGCQSGDSLVFQYSGHGSRQPNHIEGKGHEHETLCPLDFEENGMIVGEEMNKIIVNPIPQGVKLHAFIDASNNGNILDLPYLCKRKRRATSSFHVSLS